MNHANQLEKSLKMEVQNLKISSANAADINGAALSVIGNRSKVFAAFTGLFSADQKSLDQLLSPDAVKGLNAQEAVLLTDAVVTLGINLARRNVNNDLVLKTPEVTPIDLQFAAEKVTRELKAKYKPTSVKQPTDTTRPSSSDLQQS